MPRLKLDIFITKVGKWFSKFSVPRLCWCLTHPPNPCPTSSAFWVMPRPKSPKLDTVGAVSSQSLCKEWNEVGSLIHWVLEATYRRRTLGRRPETSATRGSPQLWTWPFGPGEVPGAVLWGGGLCGPAARHLTACILQLRVRATWCQGPLGCSDGRRGPRTVVGEGWQLQAAGFEQTVTTAPASRRYVLGAGTGSLNNRPGPEPGIW